MRYETLPSRSTEAPESSKQTSARRRRPARRQQRALCPSVRCSDRGGGPPRRELIARGRSLDQPPDQPAPAYRKRWEHVLAAVAANFRRGRGLVVRALLRETPDFHPHRTTFAAVASARSGSGCSSSGVDPLARVLALHSNSVCRDSIVSRAERTLTVFGVSASVLAARPVQPSYSLYGLAAFSRGATSALGQRIRPRPVTWDRPLPLALDRGGSAWQGSRRSILCPTPFPWEPG
jgi:hypothetical protein